MRFMNLEDDDDDRDADDINLSPDDVIIVVAETEEEVCCLCRKNVTCVIRLQSLSHHTHIHAPMYTRRTLLLEELLCMKKILETCILDLPDKSKTLNKLFESLEKISNAYKISAEFEEDFFMFILDEYQEQSRKNQRKLGFW